MNHKTNIAKIIGLGMILTGIFAFKTNITKTDRNQVLSVDDNFLMYNGKKYLPGDTVYGYKNYIKLVVGDKDAPLLLGVPHDGQVKGDPEIPETGKTGRDINTLPFATAISDAFRKDTRKRPWMVINTLGRKRMDPNTFPDEVDERYTNEDAKKSWLSYHEMMLTARTAMANAQKTGKGALFVDVHGHAHTYAAPMPYISVSGKLLSSKFIDQTEIGYGLTAEALRKDDAYLDQLADSSTIYAIAKANPDKKFSALIRGNESFGGLLEAEKVHAVPGNDLKMPEKNEDLFGDAKSGYRPYFNGGFLTRKYGSAAKGKTIIGFNDNISALQIETPGITVRNNDAVISISAPRFERAIVKYLKIWYGYKF
ncbi:hypothetical protein LPB86_17825 [Pedobacter sp. MC2016-14]|uniref:hypothetical protein n=1 Tax=Pedobacter sp. MC2016-14 TaxID=2897327 RepID=UPI001E3DD48D|nr:hypothetical protein [Pedobacter sp. MC2016-14]MCD0490104.1 hypothetical protein [Pedobacter sp. MC2016-14]